MKKIKIGIRNLLLFMDMPFNLQGKTKRNYSNNE